MSEQPPQYQFGDIVNGHRWTGTTWEPVQVPPPPPPPGPPTPPVEGKKKGGAGKGCGLILLVVIVIGVLAAIFGGGGDDTASDTGGTSVVQESAPAAGGDADAEAEPTLSAIDQIEAKVAEVSADNGEDRDPGFVQQEGTDLAITFPMSDNLTNGLIIAGYQKDSKDILQVVQDSGAEVKKVTVVGTFPMQDNKGNPLGDIPVATMMFTDVYEMNLENIIDIEEAADEYWVHPALQ